MSEHSGITFSQDDSICEMLIQAKEFSEIANIYGSRKELLNEISYNEFNIRAIVNLTDELDCLSISLNRRASSTQILYEKIYAYEISQAMIIRESH